MTGSPFITSQAGRRISLVFFIWPRIKWNSVPPPLHPYPKKINQFSSTTIWNLLNGQKDDGYLNSDKEPEDSFKVRSAYCHLKRVFRSSLESSEGLTWTLADEKWLTEHRQIYTTKDSRLIGVHSVSSNHMSGFKAQQSTTVWVRREWNNDHMSSLVQPQGDQLVNISLKYELNSFQMKTYISPWRWGSTICACLLI